MPEKTQSESIEDIYDRGALGYHAYWPQRHEFIEPERAEFLKQMPEGGRILDVGCGPGQDSEYFLQLGYDVTGVDLSEKFLEIARARVPAAHFEKADMRALNLPDDSFDGVWASFSLHHLSAEEAPDALRELKRVLKPGGILFISGHTADRTQNRTVPVSGLREEGSDELLSVFFQEWSQDDFKHLLKKAGLELLIFRPFLRPGGPYPLFGSLSVLPR